MKRYKNITIMPNSGHLYFHDTDSDTIDWLVGEVKKIIPNCRVTITNLDIMDKPCSCKIDQVNKKDLAISRWLFRLLLENGWEPYAVIIPSSFDVPIEESRRYYLRKSIDLEV